MKQRAQTLHGKGRLFLHQGDAVYHERKTAGKKFGGAATELHPSEIYFKIIHNGTNIRIDLDIQRYFLLFPLGRKKGALGGKIDPVVNVGAMNVIDILFHATFVNVRFICIMTSAASKGESPNRVRIL